MSGTYHSRVFTFINKRTNRLKDTCAQGFRQIKIAVVWSGQILLYPIQLLAQKTKIFQPQLKSPPPPTALPEPVPDLNIEQALDLIVEAGYPIVLAERGSLTIAADRFSGGDATRSRNPASTSSGSMTVREDISNLGHYDPETDDWEIASYRPRRSERIVANKPIVRGISCLLIDRQLVLVTTSNELLDILTISQQQEIRRRIGIDLAIDWQQWYDGELIDNDRHQQLSADRDLFLTEEISIQQLAIAESAENRSSPTLFDRLDNWLQSFKLKSLDEHLSISPETNPEIESELLHRLPPANYSFTPQPPTIDRYLDLPQLPPVRAELISPNSDNLITSTISKLQPDWLKQWWQYYRDYLYIPSTEDSQIVNYSAEFQLVPIEYKSEKKTIEQHSNLVTSDSCLNLTSENLSIEVDPESEYFQDWIDADSELIGYSKSPLAKFLAWLDRLMLQIENWLIKIWKTIAIRFSKS